MSLEILGEIAKKFVLFPKGYLRLGLSSPKGPATTGNSRNERKGRTKTLFGLGLGLGYLRLGLCSPKGRGGRWTSLDASFARCFAIF